MRDAEIAEVCRKIADTCDVISKMSEQIPDSWEGNCFQLWANAQLAEMEKILTMVERELKR